MRQTKTDMKTPKVGYETPRLQTYGTLKSLTKGTSGSGSDAGTFKPGT
jgi:hypothetical protein